MILLDSIAYSNGEIGFASKAGGYNLYIGNMAYNQSKASFYLRHPNKDFGDGNVIIDPQNSNYLLLNNVGIGRKVLAGDQGPVRIWERTNVWLYNNTLLALRVDDGTAFTGAPLTISSGSDVMAKVYAKNNIGYHVNRPQSLFFDGKTVSTPVNNRTYFGLGNLLSHGLRVHGVRNVACSNMLLNNDPNMDLAAYGIDDDVSSICGAPTFVSLDPNNDTIPHDLRLQAASLGIDSAVPYGTDADDYPSKVLEFLGAFDFFADFTLLSTTEKQELLNHILNAHTRDIAGNVRDSAPDIGAHEFVQ